MRKKIDRRKIQRDILRGWHKTVIPVQQLGLKKIIIVRRVQK